MHSTVRASLYPFGHQKGTTTLSPVHAISKAVLTQNLTGLVTRRIFSNLNLIRLLDCALTNGRKILITVSVQSEPTPRARP